MPVSYTHLRVGGDVDAAIDHLLALGPRVLMQKRGAQGSRVHIAQPDGNIERIDAPGFPVNVFNILGAGDAYAAGALYGYVQGLSLIHI